MTEPASERPAAAPPLFANPALQANPYALYATLRDSNPVFRLPIPVETGAGVWLLTRYTDVESAFRDRRFSANRRSSDVFGLYADQLPAALLEGPGASGSMLMMDPPEHTRLRGLVSKAFTPRRIAELEPRIEALVDELLGAAIAKGRFDLIHDVAEPLPAIVIAELLGVAPEDHRKFRQWSQKLIDGLPRFTPEGREEIAETLGAILDYMRAAVSQRRREPRNDLLSAMIAARDERDAMSEEELLSTALLLLVAGHETTTNLIGNGSLALARHPGEFQRLRDEPALLDNAIEEMLRYDSPVQATVRVASEPVELGGQAVEAGALVILGIAAANRDPAAHPDPDRFEVGRAGVRHLSFGLGTHFCLGAALARLEGRAFFGSLARTVSRLALDVDDSEIHYRANPILRGVRALPLRVT